MAEMVRMLDYYYAVVGNKPGEARRLLEHMSEKGVNLMALTSFPVENGMSQLDFFPEDPLMLQEAAADAGVELVGPKQAFLVQGDDRIGALHDCHLILANANINVHAANGVVSGTGGFGYILWVRPGDLQKAAEALIGSETEGHFGTLRPGGLDW